MSVDVDRGKTNEISEMQILANQKPSRSLYGAPRNARPLRLHPCTSLGPVVGTAVEKRGECGPMYVRMFHGDDTHLSNVLWFDSRSAEEAANRSFREIAWV